VPYGFKAYKVQKEAKDIATNVEALSRHLNAYNQSFRRLGVQLRSALTHYDAAAAEFVRIDTDVLNITTRRVAFL